MTRSVKCTCGVEYVESYPYFVLCLCCYRKLAFARYRDISKIHSFMNGFY